MKNVANLMCVIFLMVGMNAFAQSGKKKTPPPSNKKTTTTNQNNNTQTTGPNTSTPGNNTNNAKTTTTPGNNNDGQKNTASPSSGGGNKKLGGSTQESPYQATGMTPEEEARMVCSPITMGYSAFEGVSSKVDAASSDDDKIATIKSEVLGKKLTVAQVRTLMSKIQNEAKDLELAKYLVDFTCNKSQYGTLTDMLTAAQVQDFNDFLKTKNLSDEPGGLVKDGQ